LANTKVCKGECGKELPLDSFGKSKNTKDGFEGKCRDCRRKQKESNHSLICQQCGEKFNSAKKNTRYCSRACAGKSKHKRVLVNCSFCGKPKEVQDHIFDMLENHYCDQGCYAEHLKTLMKGENNPNYNRINVNCSGCGKHTPVQPYRFDKHKYHFCSYECYKENIGKYYIGENNGNYKPPIIVDCDGCGRSFPRKEHKVNQSAGNYCSHECYISNNIRNRERNLTTVECAECGVPVEKYQRLIEKQNFVYCSIECKNIHASKTYVGENNPKWNPNISHEDRERNRNLPGYWDWRLSVYKRDSFTCRCCGDNKGGNLVAHHKDGYHWCKERRTDITNGVTLCEDCHSDFHNTYGFSHNSEEQFNEWLLIKRKQGG
jgi:endogenous inhibitor of DNA gyrase (YacG/DUF329 family)